MVDILKQICWKWCYKNKRSNKQKMNLLFFFSFSVGCFFFFYCTFLISYIFVCCSLIPMEANRDLAYVEIIMQILFSFFFHFCFLHCYLSLLLFCSLHLFPFPDLVLLFLILMEDNRDLASIQMVMLLQNFSTR